MIHHLEGIVVDKEPGRVVIEVSGVGLELLVSNETLSHIGLSGERTRVLTHLTVREDSWTLFGFAREEERALFRMLLGVQGVGPRMAIGILSGLSVENLCRAVGEGDVAALTTISGVGKKTAQRIAVDLRDKVGALPGAEEIPGAARVFPGPERDDYSRTIAREAVRAARAPADEDVPVETLVREALRRI
jgi:Holliday junction DNA helicase RuvA